MRRRGQLRCEGTSFTLSSTPARRRMQGKDGSRRADKPDEVGAKDCLGLLDRTLFRSGGRNAEAGLFKSTSM